MKLDNRDYALFDYNQTPSKTDEFKLGSMVYTLTDLEIKRVQEFFNI